MTAEQLQKSQSYRRAARNLLTEVSALIEKAAKTADRRKRRELYLQAMSISQKAYNLLGRAKKIGEKPPFGSSN